MYYSSYYLKLCLLLLVGFTACKTLIKPTETAVEKPHATEEVKKEYPIVEMDYNWFSSRMNAGIINTETEKEMHKLSLFFVNKKDSVIYININKMAIELARIVLTVDSIKYINHINLSYYISDYSIVRKILKYPVDFYMLQSLLMNRDFPHFEKNFTIEKDENTTSLTQLNRKHLHSHLRIDQKILLNDNDRIIENTIVEKSTADTLKVTYSDFFNITSTLRTPRYLEITLVNQKIKLNLSLKDPKINVPGPTYFKIPAKYKLMEIR
ncbi:MAG TPA: DUF4292 domain-containing protein [Bacteroidales bacterium]|jgi:hypothetical protein|nr:DUF4292 domain-containing protein [Bacteroidales bacterium]HPX59856.1 DUF4292 domain-containing protein [Bacteroidales bacterium]